ncbi:hypothetical_protein [Leishmania infantum]|uniref:Hypothetical_protein n=1 Tax=Leishmania infantum TaxID=5671 RepID=A0A6L0X088_LEIIN|nr:hypothetical_protein [Leishmania infantum]SUZ40490.1 hypothetical_protein [Leishmania infantum]
MSFQPSLLVQYLRADEAFGISPILLKMLTGGFSLVASSFGTMVSCFAITAASPPDEEVAPFNDSTQDGQADRCGGISARV